MTPPVRHDVSNHRQGDYLFIHLFIFSNNFSSRNIPQTYRGPLDLLQTQTHKKANDMKSVSLSQLCHAYNPKTYSNWNSKMLNNNDNNYSYDNDNNMYRQLQRHIEKCTEDFIYKYIHDDIGKFKKK